MRIRYAYEHLGRVDHRGTFDTDHQSARAFAEALADVPKGIAVDYVLVWMPGNDSNQPDARVRQRADSGVG